jgi:hypothetical protein
MKVAIRYNDGKIEIVRCTGFGRASSGHTNNVPDWIGFWKKATEAPFLQVNPALVKSIKVVS